MTLRSLARARAPAVDHLSTRRKRRASRLPGIEIYRNDPHWKDLVLFHEYFHGDTGQGLGASHQTGWTGLVAKLLDEQSGRPWSSPSASRQGSEARIGEGVAGVGAVPLLAVEVERQPTAVYGKRMMSKRV